MNRADLLESVNLVHLIASECGPDAVRGLNPVTGGVICDPCPGHEERNPSFSVYRKGNRWRWKRHGGDGAGGDAYAFLLRLSYSPAQAWDVLARFQGVSVQGWEGSDHTTHQASDPLQQARWTLDKCNSLSAAELEKVARLVMPLIPDDLAAHDLQRRGLWGWDGLKAGKLRWDWRTKDGRLLARAGSLVLYVTGPDGQVWGIKVRNLGSKQHLETAGLLRYVYRIAGHGAPAWCSPGYGLGDAVLLVEGELNGAAASRALAQTGLSLDVQGLAGAGGIPYLHGLHSKAVYLYADPDEAGRACLDRVGQLARSAGACKVRVIVSDSENDFCDLLGKLGAAEFGRVLTGLMEASTTYHTVLPSGKSDGKRMDSFLPSHQTLGIGNLVKVRDPLKKYRARLGKYLGGIR